MGNSDDLDISSILSTVPVHSNPIERMGISSCTYTTRNLDIVGGTNNTFMIGQNHCGYVNVPSPFFREGGGLFKEEDFVLDVRVYINDYSEGGLRFLKRFGSVWMKALVILSNKNKAEKMTYIESPRNGISLTDLDNEMHFSLPGFTNSSPQHFERVTDNFLRLDRILIPSDQNLSVIKKFRKGDVVRYMGKEWLVEGFLYIEKDINKHYIVISSVNHKYSSVDLELKPMDRGPVPEWLNLATCIVPLRGDIEDEMYKHFLI